MSILTKTEDGSIRTTSATLVFLLTRFGNYRVVGTRLVPKWNLMGNVGFRRVWLLA